VGGDDQHCDGAGADEAVSENHLISLECGLADWPPRSTLRKSTRLGLPARPFVLVEFTQQNSGRCWMRVWVRRSRRSGCWRRSIFISESTGIAATITNSNVTPPLALRAPVSDPTRQFRTLLIEDPLGVKDGCRRQLDSTAGLPPVPERPACAQAVTLGAITGSLTHGRWRLHPRGRARN